MFASYERFDGTGQPLGLKADEIPFLARILGVVYATDSIIADYWRKPRASMLAEIQRWSGSRFDPKVVNSVLSIPEETWAKIR
jgi:HD-GYP domain-containing protein (c-di-GMP phosphodiesterase class II)